MLKCKVKIKHNFKRIEKLQSQLIETTQNMLEDVLKNIRGYAIRLERGHNSSGILVEMIDMSNQEVKGRVYADPSQFMTNDGVSYLFFEYFGTGTSAEMEHIGTTKHFLETNYEQWFIPVNKVGRGLNYPIITLGDSQFYVAHGTKANHFLTDAEFKARQENKYIVNKKIKKMLEECCK